MRAVLRVDMGYVSNFGLNRLNAVGLTRPEDPVHLGCSVRHRTGQRVDLCSAFLQIGGRADRGSRSLTLAD